MKILVGLGTCGVAAGAGATYAAILAKAGSLEQLSRSSFVARRNALWNAQTRSDELSPTGRFRALKSVPGRSAGAA